MNTAISTTIEHILNLKVTLWGSPSCAATRRVCKVRGIASPSENYFQWEHNSILANLLLNNIYVDKFRMVFVKTADCTHVHNSVCMPELTVGCKWLFTWGKPSVVTVLMNGPAKEGGSLIRLKLLIATTAKFVFVLVAPFLPWCLVYTSVNKTEYFGPRKIANW